MRKFGFLLKKRHPKAPFLISIKNRSDGERLDLSRQAALVARGLVLVDDFFVSNTVDNRNRFLVDALSSSLVACTDRLLDTLYGGAQGRAQACVVGALFDGLASTFAGLCAVGHEFLSLKKANALIEKPRFYR